MTIKECILDCAQQMETEAEVVEEVCYSLKCIPGSVRNCMQRLRLEGHLGHLQRELRHRGRNVRQGNGWRFGD